MAEFTQPYYQDINAFLGPGAGGSTQGLTTQPGTGLAQPAITGNVPNQGTSIGDVLTQIGVSQTGGQQGGDINDRIAMAGSAGFADPTFGNIIRSIMTGLTLASPMGPFDIAAGEAIQGLHLPGYVSPIMSVLGQLGGVPFSPTALPDLTGAGTIPQSLRDQLMRHLITPQQYAAAVQQLQAEHGGAGTLHPDFSGEGTVPGAHLLGGGAGGGPIGPIGADATGGGISSTDGGGLGGQAGRAGF